MDRGTKRLLWLCAVLLLLFLSAASVGGSMVLRQVQQLQQELVQLRNEMERFNNCLDENLDDIAALCASVPEAQQWIQELFEGGNPLAKLLPD